MAFDVGKLFTAAGIYNSSEYGLAPAIHTYTSSADTLAAILTVDYFPVSFNVDPQRVRTDDIIFLVGSDARSIGYITALNPVAISTY